MPSRPQPEISGSRPSTTKATVLEFICLFTRDIKRKNQKRWVDGRLKFHTYNKSISVVDEHGYRIGDSKWYGELADFSEGVDLKLESAPVLVEVCEEVGRQEQDLGDVVDKRVREVEERRAKAAHSPTVGLRPNDNLRLSTIQRPHNGNLPTPGPIGRAVIPTESPYEVRKRAEGHDDTPPSSKRRKRSESPPAKTGHARALFGTQLILSARPMSTPFLASRSQVLRDKTNMRLLSFIPPAREKHNGNEDEDDDYDDVVMVGAPEPTVSEKSTQAKPRSKLQNQPLQRRRSKCDNDGIVTVEDHEKVLQRSKPPNLPPSGKPRNSKEDDDEPMPGKGPLPPRPQLETKKRSQNKCLRERSEEDQDDMIMSEKSQQGQKKATPPNFENSRKQQDTFTRERGKDDEDYDVMIVDNSPPSQQNSKTQEILQPSNPVSDGYRQPTFETTAASERRTKLKKSTKPLGIKQITADENKGPLCVDPRPSLQDVGPSKNGDNTAHRITPANKQSLSEARQATLGRKAADPRDGGDSKLDDDHVSTASKETSRCPATGLDLASREAQPRTELRIKVRRKRGLVMLSEKIPPAKEAEQISTEHAADCQPLPPSVDQSFDDWLLGSALKAAKDDASAPAHVSIVRRKDPDQFLARFNDSNSNTISVSTEASTITKEFTEESGVVQNTRKTVETFLPDTSSTSQKKQYQKRHVVTSAASSIYDLPQSSDENPCSSRRDNDNHRGKKAQRAEAVEMVCHEARDKGISLQSPTLSDDGDGVLNDGDAPQSRSRRSRKQTKTRVKKLGTAKGMILGCDDDQSESDNDWEGSPTAKSKHTKTNTKTMSKKNKTPSAGPRIARMARKSVKCKEIFGFKPPDSDCVVPNELATAIGRVRLEQVARATAVREVPQAQEKETRKGETSQQQPSSGTNTNKGKDQDRSDGLLRRIANPATRGKKAAKEADAAGLVPQVIVPFDPVPARITVGPALVPASVPAQVQTTARPPTSNDSKLPGFSKANGGAWSKHAEDLLGMVRPKGRLTTQV